MTSTLDHTHFTHKKIAELEQELQELKQIILQDRQHACAIPFPVSTLVVRVWSYFFAIPIKEVEKVTHMVIVSPLPGAPPAIRGTIVYRGQLVPVLDLSVGFSEAPMHLAEDVFLIVVSTKTRYYALPVHKIQGVLTFEVKTLQTMSETTVFPMFVACVLKSDQGAVILLDTAKLLAAGECDLLDQAMVDIMPEKTDGPAE